MQACLRVTMCCPQPWSLFLLGLLMGPGASGEDPESLAVTGTLGESVILPLQLQSGQQVESVSWTARSEPRAFASITVKDTGGPDVFYQVEPQYSYRGRVNLVGPDHSLRISNLSLEDAGPYRAHINLKHSRITYTRKYYLQVWEKLAQPHVTLSSRTGENGHCIVILTCVAESRGTVTYSWTSLRPGTVVSQGGSVLSFSVRPEDSALTFTCIIKNPVSNSSSYPVSVPHFCTGSGILLKDAVGKTVIGTLRELATLPLEVPAEQEVESVTWTSEGLVAILHPGLGGRPVLVSESQGPYSDRLSSPHHGYSLQISPLELQDSGLYRAWITLREPLMNITKDFILHVYERLKKPNITVSSQIRRDRACVFTLVCSLEQAGEDVQYNWDPQGHGAVVSHGGTTLTVLWTTGHNDSYHCTAKNPVSQSSVSIPVRSICSASSLLCSLRKEFLFIFLVGTLKMEQI